VKNPEAKTGVCVLTANPDIVLNTVTPFDEI